MSRFISYLNSCNCRVTYKEELKETKSSPFFCKLTLNNGSVVELKGSGELTSAMISEYSNTVVSAEIGELCTSIGASAFANCINLRSVNIPDSVTSIGSKAFYSCSALTSCTFDENSQIATIYAITFSGCTSLTNINIPNSVTSIGNNAFKDCTNLTNINISNNVTSIGSNVFNGCTNLTSVTIGNSVTSIGGGAFYGCTSLTSVTVNATTPPTLGSNAIESMPCGIYVPCESLSSYIETWNDVRIKSIDCPLPNNMIRYTGSKLSDTTSNKSGGLHTNAFNTTIKKHLWNYGTGLIIFNDDITSIGDYAFYKCTDLTSIEIPDSITRIGLAAFGYCTGLKSFTLPKNLKSTGPEPFTYTNIISVTINCNGFQTGGTGLDPVELIIGSEVESLNYAVISNTNLSKITSLATTAPTISSNTFSGIKTNGTLYVPVDSSGYDVWMGTGNYCLGKYGWTMVEQ